MDLAREGYDHIMQEHAKETFEKKIAICIQHALKNSLKNLKIFPWIDERLKDGNLELHVWYFNLETGTIHKYNEIKKDWMF